MKDRIRQVRKYYNLSMQAFGERLGISKEAIRLLECGKTSPAERTFNAICKTYHVNEAWLRTGEGGDEPIIEENSHDLIDMLAAEYNLGNLERLILETYLDMSDVERRTFAAIVHKAAEKITNADYSDTAEKDFSQIIEDSRRLADDQPSELPAE